MPDTAITLFNESTDDRRTPTDWGVVGKPRFDRMQLCELRRECQPHCFSTLNHNLAYCYNMGRAIKWTLKQALNGFRGTTGSFED